MEVTIFDKPSGDVRGFAIQTMMFPKGKSMVEKRICHANIFQDSPSDGVTIDAPKKMTPDQMREFAAKLISFADEVELQYAFPRGALNYDQVLEAYERILKANPGKALVLDTNVVAIIHDGSLLVADMWKEGVLNIAEMYEFDPRTFSHAVGHWGRESSWEETAKAINQPELIDYTIVDPA